MCIQGNGGCHIEGSVGRNLVPVVQPAFSENKNRNYSLQLQSMEQGIVWCYKFGSGKTSQIGWKLGAIIIDIQLYFIILFLALLGIAPVAALSSKQGFPLIFSSSNLSVIYKPRFDIYTQIGQSCTCSSDFSSISFLSVFDDLCFPHLISC